MATSSKTETPVIRTADALTSLCDLHPALTPSRLEALRAHSTTAKSHAYCPYSHFRVGATLLTVDGGFINGANVENAAYPVGICAERVALGTAIYLAGEPVESGAREKARRNFVALAIATDGETPASPCGMCRQLCVARHLSASSFPSPPVTSMNQLSVMSDEANN